MNQKSSLSFLALKIISYCISSFLALDFFREEKGDLSMRERGKEKVHDAKEEDQCNPKHKKIIAPKILGGGFVSF
jgi:hypothetical protein